MLGVVRPGTARGAAAKNREVVPVANTRIETTRSHTPRNNEPSNAVQKTFQFRDTLPVRTLDLEAAKKLKTKTQ